MKTPTSADALRVARALLGVSIRELEPRVKLVRKAIAAAESGASTNLEHNIRLIQFYDAAGIEFLGDLAFGSEVGRAGARWKAPVDVVPSTVGKTPFHTEKSPNSFAAARALLGKKQSVVAQEARLPVTTISSLELGSMWSASSETLRNYYLKEGVEFLGWATAAAPGMYYGIGVRLASVTERT